MDIFTTIEQRRAVKHYDAAFEMPQQDVDKLVSSMLLSPTSFNIQNWRFVNVQDTALRQEIRACAWDQAQVTDASLLFVLCADLKAWENQPERYWQNAPEEVQGMLVPMIGEFYQGREQLQRDEAMRSVGIASQTLMLAAKGLGYDSCPMIGFDAQKVAQLIKLPEDHVIGMMVTVGKATKPAWSRGGQLSQTEVVTTNTF